MKKEYRGKFNNDNFDTLFVTIDKILTILWHLRDAKYPFQLLQQIVLRTLTKLIGFTMISISKARDLNHLSLHALLFLQ